MNTHRLKTYTKYFDAVVSGKKKFEYRRNDRGFQVGDMLELLEFEPISGFSGRTATFRVTFVLDDSWPDMKPGFCVLSITEAH